MASITLPCLALANRLPNLIRSGLSSRSRQILNSTAATQAPRHYSTGETKEKPIQQEVDLTENEKKLTAEVESLTKNVQELKEKNEELLDKYKRALADGENLRVRLTKQIEDAKIFGIQGFCKDLLEVADILGAATDAVPKDAVSDKNPHLKNLYEGLSMTRASLMHVFTRHGLEQVNPLNEKFDPNLHEALFQKDAPGAAPNTVVEVSKIGYKLKARCIRPALVGVSKSYILNENRLTENSAK